MWILGLKGIYKNRIQVYRVCTPKRLCQDFCFANSSRVEMVTYEKLQDHLIHKYYGIVPQKQRAKKVMPNSLGLVDFASEFCS